MAAMNSDFVSKGLVSLSSYINLNIPWIKHIKKRLVEEQLIFY